MSKVICIFFAMFLTVILSIMVMIKGWGLEPQSWGWIIGVGFGAQLVIQLLVEIVKGDG